MSSKLVLRARAWTQSASASNGAATSSSPQDSRQEPCDREREETVAEADSLRPVVGEDGGDALS